MVLRDITLDPSSIEGPIADTGFRPEGLACNISGWSPGHQGVEKPDLRLTLTEYPDPDGEEIYFTLTDNSLAVDDELIEE